MLKDLFEFPTIMVDGENEERKQAEQERLALDDKEKEYDIVEGKAEYPYFDFIGIEDRWLPTQESLDRALRGKFDACIVKFTNIPQLLVPWTRSKFKREMQKFIDEREKTEEKEEVLKDITVLKLTPDMLKEIVKKVEDNEKNG